MTAVAGGHHDERIATYPELLVVLGVYTSEAAGAVLYSILLFFVWNCSVKIKMFAADVEKTLAPHNAVSDDTSFGDTESTEKDLAGLKARKKYDHRSPPLNLC